jgi:hypothetical protein
MTAGHDAGIGFRIAPGGGIDNTDHYYTKDWQVIEDRANEGATITAQYVWVERALPPD